jgi:hypothetical protein
MVLGQSMNSRHGDSPAFILPAEPVLAHQAPRHRPLARTEQYLCTLKVNKFSEINILEKGRA